MTTKSSKKKSSKKKSTRTTASKKRTPAKKLARTAKTASAGKTTSAGASTSSRQVVDKQPQSKEQAAESKGIFLYTDDAWSLRYFDQNDLHCKEREVFG